MLPSHPTTMTDTPNPASPATPADDTLFLRMSDEALKNFLRQGFAYGGLDEEAALDEYVLLIRRHGFAAFLDLLASAEQELIVQVPGDHVPATEDDILALGAQMRQVTPTYSPGDLVAYRGDLYEIASYQTEDPPGYWLKRGKETTFVPIGQEHCLTPI